MAGAQVSHANCGHCGAPLPLSHGSIVVCQYCGRESRFHAPRVAPATPAAPARSNAALIVSILAALAIVGLGIGVFVVRLLIGAPTGAANGGIASRSGVGGVLAAVSGPMFWLDYPPVVLLGASTAAPQVVGMAYWQSDSQITALDGASGKVLWHVPSPTARVYTNGDALLAFDDGKKLTRFEPKTGVKRWNLVLADTVYDITFGPSCASLLHPNGKKLGIDLQTGQVASCTPVVESALPILRDKIVDVTGTSSDLAFVGSVQLDDKPVNPEPPRLLAQVSRAGHPLWKVAPAGIEPVWTSDGFGRSLALTPAGIFVFGRSSSDHSTTFALLELTTGRELYRKTSPLKVERPVQMLNAGALLFTEHDSRVEAYRVATGDLVWSLGLQK